MNLKKIFYLLIFIYIFNGCGSSSNTNTEQQIIEIENTTTVSGTVVDGYIKDALVCLDINNNNLCDVDEPKTTTDVNGYFLFKKIDKNIGEKKIIIEGGIDTATNSIFKAKLTRKIDIKIDKIDDISITPLTTMIDYLGESETNIEVKNMLSNKLNISIDKLEEDPMKDIELFKTTQKIMQTIQTIQENDTNLSTIDGFEYLIKKTSDSIKNNDMSDYNTTLIVEDLNDDNKINITDELKNEISNTINYIENKEIINIDSLNDIQDEFSSISTIDNNTSESGDDNTSNLEDLSIIDKLNNLRELSGLNKLYQNQNLNTSAMNHAKYLNINNISGHEEETNLDGFTGVTPSDRTVFAGYKSKIVSENLSVGQETEQKSLDGLMSAIYHRFGFLDFNINELGYYKENNVYVYNMGNSYLNNLCNGESFSGYGSYYYDICADSDFKIEVDTYDTEKNKLQDKNPEYVIYPYNNQLEVDTVFFEETPDPLPNYSVSGYPISIEFNKNKIDIDLFTITSFEIKDVDGNVIPLIEHDDGNVIMSKTNDLNNHFTDLQYAIFPQKRLDFNTTYNVSFVYIYDGDEKIINWQFKTKEINDLVIYNNTDINIDLNKSFNLYFPPESETDIISTYGVNCTYASTGNVLSTISVYDQNIINIKIEGVGVDYCDVNINNINKLRLNINK